MRGGDLGGDAPPRVELRHVRRTTVLLAAMALPLLVSHPSRAADAPGTFDQTGVAAQQLVGEPRAIAVPGTDTLYVVAPSFPGQNNSTKVWRSLDGGHTFGPAAQTLGGSGDGDLAVDPGDPSIVYAADLFDSPGGTDSTLPVSISTDGGATFSRRVAMDPSASGLVYDREWIASPRPGQVVVTARGGNEDIYAWISTDHGLTFSKRITAVEQFMFVAGPMTVAPDKTVYFAYAVPSPDAPTAKYESFSALALDNLDLRYAASLDGVHWRTGLVASDVAVNEFPVMAADGAGNLYAAWSGATTGSGAGQLGGDAAGGMTVIATLRAGSSKWTPPTPVSDATPDPSGRPPTTVFGWVVAGRPGVVKVSYAVANQPVLNGSNNTGMAGTTWDIVVAESSNAATPKPTWTQSVAATAFHAGSICTVGFECVGPQGEGYGNVPLPGDRRDLEFFGSAMLPNGAIGIPYGRDRPTGTDASSDLLHSNVDVYLAVEHR